jgi:hypothetical protein
LTGVQMRFINRVVIIYIPRFLSVLTGSEWADSGLQNCYNRIVSERYRTCTHKTKREPEDGWCAESTTSSTCDKQHIFIRFSHWKKVHLTNSSTRSECFEMPGYVRVCSPPLWMHCPVDYSVNMHMF